MYFHLEDRYKSHYETINKKTKIVYRIQTCYFINILVMVFKYFNILVKFSPQFKSPMNLSSITDLDL